ncbi:helix-turn-helix domain-containing protein [Sandaracinobacteroides saxicola]|uniref:Helix-turn-helix domain-containing protein n=1 Tax=Sandaracinobacteroides saxicola TaxID=2759707 RepID=A0A7G5IMT4_9SPHN|nr:helix-turn-helix domain-containing protein [Sandaracinobacteroides saxicola]
MARLCEAGQSIRQIAAALDRQPSPVARELKRNSRIKPLTEHRPQHHRNSHRNFSLWKT